jgi:hypothetical protein
MCAGLKQKKTCFDQKKTPNSLFGVKGLFGRDSDSPNSDLLVWIHQKISQTLFLPPDSDPPNW